MPDPATGSESNFRLANPLTAGALQLSLNELTLNLSRWRVRMGGRTVLGTLAGKGPAQRVEVSLSQGDDGRLLIDLREQHHAEGIGWFDQRRLELDPRQLQQLQAILALKSDVLDAAVLEAPATVPFPGPVGSVACRRAVGGERG